MRDIKLIKWLFKNCVGLLQMPTAREALLPPLTPLTQHGRRFAYCTAAQRSLPPRLETHGSCPLLTVFATAMRPLNLPLVTENLERK